MDKIKTNDLLDQIKLMQLKETIFIPISSEIVDAILLSHIQKASLDNLFMSYINNTTELSNKLNLDNFIAKYTEVYTTAFNSIGSYILQSFGEEVYKILHYNKQYYYNTDFNIKQIIINKR